MAASPEIAAGRADIAAVAAEIFATLYYDTMRLRRGEPKWADRDRFLMGKGHAAVGLFPILADWDFFPKDLLDGYTRLGNPLGDHPDMRRVPGIDFSSGSIGHALSGGLGMALDTARAKVKQLQADFDGWKDTSLSADYPEGQATAAR